MASSTTKSYWRGVRDGLPFLLVVGPFGLLFGVVGTEAGLTLAQTMGFSIVVIAGASQFAALQLMVNDAPTLVVLATALAVNLRMAMYSAALTPHLGPAKLWQRAVAAYFTVDQTYALSAVMFERAPAAPLAEKVAYFFGTVTPICPFWYVATLIGAVAGTAIPDGFALDFAVPITFLAIVVTMLRTAAHVAAASASVVVALALHGLPWGTGLIAAGLVAMSVGASVELLLERRAVWR